MLKLIQLICNSGGEYVLKASKSNIFVKYDDVYDKEGLIRECSRFNYVKAAKKMGVI